MVSGYSGGDIVACQAAGAMNMNKGFWLPANFCLLETANDKARPWPCRGFRTGGSVRGEYVMSACILEEGTPFGVPSSQP